eukprot:2442164-Pleurochrysis_carterae.AAC.1
MKEKATAQLEGGNVMHRKDGKPSGQNQRPKGFARQSWGQASIRLSEQNASSEQSEERCNLMKGRKG